MESDDDTALSKDDFPNICRLCLQTDDFMVNIFHRFDSNPNKKPLVDRLYHLYQIKVEKHGILPTNICHKCLYYTEAFSEFHDQVRKSEQVLQKEALKLAGEGSSEPPSYVEVRIKTEDGEEIQPHQNITVIDPDQYDCEDTNEENSSIDENEENELHIESEMEAATSPSLSPSTTTTATTVTTAASTAAAQLIMDESILLSSQLEESVEDENMKNFYFCQYCDRAFTERFDCEQHESCSHDPARPFSCNYCPFSCPERFEILSHIHNLHNFKRPYVCVLCNKAFLRKTDLRKHAIVHIGARPFTCQICNKGFSRNTNLNKHMRIHAGEKPYVCSTCPRSFTSIEDLNRHGKIHIDQKMYYCDICPASFTRRDKLFKHKSHQHENKGKENNTSSDALKSKREKLAINMNPDQNQSFIPENSTDINMKDISQSSVGDQNSQLLNGFEQSVLENSYQKSETTQPVKKIRRRNFVCPTCSKAFLRRRELEKHSYVHTGIKPHPCRFCNKRFFQRYKAVNHEKLHHQAEMGKLECTQCQFVFASKEALETHMKGHENENEQEHLSEPQPGSSNMNSFQNIPSTSTGITASGLPLNSLYPNLLFSAYQEGFRPQMNFYNEIETDY